MTPRKPYRSPFWRPELDDPPPSRPTAREAKVAPHAEPSTWRSAPPHRSVERTAPERSVTYAPSDLALFGRLAVFGNRTDAAQTHHTAQPPRREPAVRAKVEHRSAASGAYTSRDASLFQSLEAVFSATRSPPSTLSAASASPTRSYSPADLEAFEKLAKYGRSG